MSKDNPPTFTVFTATYNRAHTLHRVFESLRAQTFRDFEWLVVDDGSRDDTSVMINAWRNEASFPIRYIHQRNCGKHIAFNRGVREAKGLFFLSLDSDDACVANALERLKHHWDTIPNVLKPEFSAVTALCINQNNQLVGTFFPRDPTDSNPLEIRYRHKVRGEKWGFHLTEVLREYPFPELHDHFFVTESIVWNRIAHSYKTRYVNEILRIYYIESSQDSLSKRASEVKEGAPIFSLSNQITLNEDLAWFRFSPFSFVKAAANYARYSLHMRTCVAAQLRSLEPMGSRVLYLLALPLGYILYQLDRGRSSENVRAQAR